MAMDKLANLESFLRCYHPDCVLIPTLNNFVEFQDNSGGKQPAWKHKGVPAAALWGRWDATGRDSCDKGVVLILRGGILVIDIDDKALADVFAEMFPEAAQTVVQETRSGRHFWFKRTSACDDAKVHDGARQLAVKTMHAKQLHECLPDDQKGSRLPIDIKTISSTGTGGAISVCPSPGKEWHIGKGPYERPMLELPETILRFLLDNRHSGNLEPDGDDASMHSVAQYYNDLPASVSEASFSQHSLRSQVQPAVTEHEVLTTLVMECLSAERATEYDDWLRVGFALYNACHEKQYGTPEVLFQLWVSFSQRSYNPDKIATANECRLKWGTFPTDRSATAKVSLGTIHMWAKQDSPDAYRALMARSVKHLMAKCDSTKHHAMAELLHALYGTQFVCASIKGKSWYTFRGHRWVKDEDGHSLRRLMSREVAGMFLREAQELERKAERMCTSGDDDESKIKMKALVARARIMSSVAVRLDNTGFKDQVLKACADIFIDSGFMTRLDAHVHLLGFDNGVYDLDEGIFRAGRPDDYISMTVGYDYPEDDDLEIQGKLIRFVKSTQQSPELADYVINVLAYSLHGNKFMENIWFWVGPRGRNGKSLLATTLMGETMGEYHYAPDAAIIMSNKVMTSTGPKPEVRALAGRRFVVISEPSDSGDSSFNASRLKSWRGNDIIQARGLYEDVSAIKPQFAMVFCMNNRPPMDRMDQAVASTLRVVEFPWEFVNDPQLEHQRQLDASLKSLFGTKPYASQFMRILLKRYNHLRHDYLRPCKPFPVPPSVLLATSTYVEEQNHVVEWLHANYDITGDVNDVVTADALRGTYNASVPRNEQLNRRDFKSAMEVAGFKSEKATKGETRGAMTYYGIKERLGD